MSLPPSIVDLRVICATANAFSFPHIFPVTVNACSVFDRYKSYINIRTAADKHLCLFFFLKIYEHFQLKKTSYFKMTRNYNIISDEKPDVLKVTSIDMDDKSKRKHRIVGKKNFKFL